MTRACLHGPQGATAAGDICRKLKRAIKAYETNVGDHDGLLRELLSLQPIAALDALCGGDAQELERDGAILRDVAQLRQNPLDVLPTETLLLWCNAQPASRFPAIARVITTSEHQENTPIKWTEKARALLQNAPDPVAVLQAYIQQFGRILPGPQLAEIEAKIALLDELKTHRDTRIAEYAQREAVRLRSAVNSARAAQTDSDRERDESFE